MMTPEKVNHIGFAVPSIADFLEQNAALYGKFSRGPLIVNDVQGVKEMFITDGKTVLELLEPMGESSPINGFLKRSPSGGLIHLALDVDNLGETIENVERMGGRVISGPVPDIAFQNRRIAFVFLNGLVTELIEKPQNLHGDDSKN